MHSKEAADLRIFKYGFVCQILGTATRGKEKKTLYSMCYGIQKLEFLLCTCASVYAHLQVQLYT